MIQLDYTTPNTEQSVYISTQDNRIDTNATNLAFLFEVTNDISGSIVFVYLIKTVIKDRYTTGALIPVNTSPNMYNGQFIALPVGYYAYKVYECSTSSTNTVNVSELTAPIDNTGKLGTVTVRKNSQSGTIVATTNLTNADKVTNLKVSDLTTGTYYLRMESNGGTLINNPGLSSIGLTQVQAQSDGKRWLEVTDVTETSTGMDITIVSECPTGYSYEFDNNAGAYQSLVEITSKPQTNVISLNASTMSAPILRLYDSSNGHSGSGSQVWGASNGRQFVVGGTTGNYGLAGPTAWNPQMIDSGGTAISGGSFYYNARYGTATNQSTQEFFVLQGEVTKGKMYISQTDETLKEVTYKQHEQASSTNYIYYGQ
tara:strand:+ start:74 stop:1186 length:1113 start_codon:yes stop_codon:yes gene_type:complete